MAPTAYQGVNYAKTQTTPITQIEEGQFNSPTLHVLDQFVLTADLAASDTILMGGPLPQGAVILDAKCVTGALGGSAALNFGYKGVKDAFDPFAGAETVQADDLTAFFSALPVSSATYASAFGNTYQGDYYAQVALTSQVQPIITCSVASSGATGKTIYIDISYTKNGG